MQKRYNYKHLHYFWVVARAGGVSRAALKLHLTPQTLSGQIKQLEASLGVALFHSVGKRLELTEAGRVALSYADEIFSLANELGEALSGLPAGQRQWFRVGIADAIPKSLVQRLLAPVLELTDAPRLQCREGPLDNLLGELAVHRLDLVLTTRPLPKLNVCAYSHRLGESRVGLYAPRSLGLSAADFPRCLHGQPMLMPGADSALHGDLLEWLERSRLLPRVVGEFDDSALIKTFARAGAGVFAAPDVIGDEISSIYQAERLGGLEPLRETYYALSTERRLRHPGTRCLVESAGGVLG